MKQYLGLLLFVAFVVQAQDKGVSTKSNTGKKVPGDWLVDQYNAKATIIAESSNKDIILTNGLIRRSFRLSPNLACTDYSNLITGQQLLRAVMPEAVIVIDGKEYNVGGLHGQKEKAYLLPEWVSGFTKSDDDFQFVNYEISLLKPFINWKAEGWWAMNKKQPQGKVISFSYRHQQNELKDLLVKVHYALYDGLPLIAKWVTIENKGATVFKINTVKNEVLAVVEEESAVVGSPDKMKKQQGIYIETNYAFNNSMRYEISDQTLHWKTDRQYTSQVNYDYTTPCVLEIYPDKAPGVELQSGETITSVNSFELLMDSYDRERRGRWHLGKNAIHGMGICSAYPLPGRRSRSSVGTFTGAP